MIVPMKHATVLCLSKDRDAALKALADLGLVHVEVSVADSPGVAAAALAGDAAECARDAIAEARANRDDLGLALRPPPAGAAAAGVVAEALACVGRYVEARSRRAELVQRAARWAPWGDFDPAAARALARKGVPVSLFELPAGFDLAAFSARGVLRILSRDKEKIRGAFLGAPLPEGVEALPLPPESLGATRAGAAAAEAGMREAAASLRALAPRAGEAAAAVGAAAEAKTAALAAANLLDAGPVSHLQGWIPADGADALLAAARREGWGVALRDPAEGETPPVQLRPPRAFRPILTLLGALGILPGYSETDISVPFYAFFTLFFAMLVGDAGYGLLLLALWAALRKKLRASPQAGVRAVSTLLLVFSCATVAWGVASGTWFGMPAAWLPAWMNRDLPTARWLGDQGNIMWLCFTIGLAHLELARGWNVMQLWPDSKALAELGWGGVLLGMYFVVCSIAVPGCSFPVWAGVVMGVSVLLVLLFSYKKSELKENVVSLCLTPLNVISSMGDIISYVRLFAVGLAAVKIAETFDTMAAGLALPLWIKIPCMVLILLLGHALNLVMGALSILVHAVRLNTLEFSNAKGISWSGAPYAPFRAPGAADGA
ncbi:MAG: hypothetical protein IJV65_06920 [Kiritimatiellae bacterium]|nr:hypothetical protein [Kiritimatiellia bacterium]